MPSGTDSPGKPQKLSKADLKAFQKAHPRWICSSEALHRTLRFSTYMDGIAFVQKVAELADKADHHPDLIVKWHEVEVDLTSHDVGGITRRDTQLAARIEELSHQFT